MREILSGVYTWSRLSEPHGYDFNGYLVVQPEGNLCVDPVRAAAFVYRITEEGLEALERERESRERLAFRGFDDL